MMSLLLLGATVSALPTSEVVLKDRSIKVGDVAITEGYDQDVIGQLPARTDVIELDEASAERLLRNRFPSLAFRLRFRDRVRLSAPSGAPDVRTGSCLAASVDVQPHEPITLSNTLEVACGAGPVPKVLGYDAETRSTFARAFIPAGTVLGAPRLHEVQNVPEGQAMTLRFVSGPVVIEREVVTLQPGMPGDRVFAVTGDGKVVTAPLAQDEKEDPQ
jgi:hypothetical protein